MIAPKISIVTPSYNQGRFIESAIASVRAQRYPDFEHIIVDNCSTDSTIEKLNKYPHLRWISEPDSGQSNALNKGFKLATGDIVGWLNADEFYFPQALDSIREAFNNDKKFQIVYGDAAFVDERGDFLRYRAAHSFDYGLLLYYGPYIQTCSFFFSRSIVDEGFFINESFSYAMDTEYFLRLANHKKDFLYIPKCLGAFRWTTENKSLKPNREGLAIRRKYGAVLASSKLGARLFNRLSIPKRVLRKLIGGGIFREYSNNMKFKGKNMNWFSQAMQRSAG